MGRTSEGKRPSEEEEMQKLRNEEGLVELAVRPLPLWDPKEFMG